MPPSDVTVSTRKSVSVRASAAPSSASGWRAPVEVSAWTIASTRARG
jgi:hypothetical protein